MMCIISKTIYLSSVFSLVYPVASFASFNPAYASLVDTSQNQTFESRPANSILDLLHSKSLKNFPKLANVKFIVGGNDLDFGGREFTEADLCVQQGYRLTSCPSGHLKGDVCPYDSKFVKNCIDPDTWCKNNGYNVTFCTVPKYLTTVCPYNSTLYKSCETDNIRACKELGYSLTCETGKVGDSAQTCSYNSSYKKCICNPCSGYDYTAEQASAQGYIPGEVCNSCGTMKYKRSENACSGYKTCDCGGETGAKVCYSGTTQKFDTCKTCCDSKFQYDSSNCTGGNVLAGNSCGGKYEKCEAKVRAGDILYSDMTVNSEIISGKTPIGIVFDTTNKLAISHVGTASGYYYKCYGQLDGAGDGGLEREALLGGKSTEAEALADMAGAENTAKMRAEGNTTYAIRYSCSSGLYRPLSYEGVAPEEWFAPSLGQLKILYANREAVDAGLNKVNSSLSGLFRRVSVGNILGRLVWSSTYKDASMAWIYDFDKDDAYLVGQANKAYISPVISYNRDMNCYDYIYDESNCETGLGGNVCNGKYEICQTVKTLPLLYDDKSVSYTYNPDKYVIGIVIDEVNRLAIPINGTSGMFTDSFEGDLSGPKPQLKAIEGLKNCTKENVKVCDTDGLKNTKAVLDFGAKIGQTYPTFERVYGRSYVWGMEGADNCNCWYGKGKWFVPSAAQLFQFYDNYERVVATTKLIPATIVHGSRRYGYTPSFNSNLMSSNQADAEHYWSVRGRSTKNDPLWKNGKWPYPSISSDGTIGFAGEDTLPMLHY